ncbi:MAG: monofunctional biosynthetic peptidoglycan transglycosylase [Pseudomonadota bacterium]
MRLWVVRVAIAVPVILVLWIAIFALVDPPITPYMIGEARREGPLKQDWADIEDISPHMARSVVAAEDANFCLHWGFDMAAIRDALEDGADRGASTISQQVVKNVFLWQGRSWPRKAAEAAMTPLLEALWTKRRIVEVYMNVAEFDRGVFGVKAAAMHYYGVGAGELTRTQAALLAAILPNPKGRSASNPGPFTKKRAEAIVDGAATIDTDGRAACFED